MKLLYDYLMSRENDDDEMVCFFFSVVLMNSRENKNKNREIQIKYNVRETRESKRGSGERCKMVFVRREKTNNLKHHCAFTRLFFQKS